jgi:hypothetical protein
MTTAPRLKADQVRQQIVRSHNAITEALNPTERGLYMIAEQEHLVCTNHECGAEFIVRRKPALGKQNLRCACGSEVKKYYHAPEVWILKTTGTEKDRILVPK